MSKIVPSILTDSVNEARDLIQRCELVFGSDPALIDRISIDIVDGVFAKNKTIDPLILSDIDTNLKLDFQLMVNEPVNWVEKCFSAGADRIIGHIEKMKSQVEFVGKVSGLGSKVGLALDIDTPVEALDPLLLTNLDVVLLMSYPAGIGGQRLNEAVFGKIKKLVDIREADQTPFVIHLDGGVRKENIKKIFLEGVDEVSIGRSIFENDLKENINNYLDII